MLDARVGDEAQDRTSPAQDGYSSRQVTAHEESDTRSGERDQRDQEETCGSEAHRGG